MEAEINKTTLIDWVVGGAGVGSLISIKIMGLGSGMAWEHERIHEPNSSISNLLDFE